MGRKTIPLKDKKTVIDRVAKGASFRQAIKGTSISSMETARNITRSVDIGRMRSDFVAVVEQEFNYNQKRQAERLVSLLDAEMVKGSMTEPDRWVPDHITRLKALQYFHKLKGINIEDADVNVTMPILIVDHNGQTNRTTDPTPTA